MYRAASMPRRSDVQPPPASRFHGAVADVGVSTEKSARCARRRDAVQGRDTATRNRSQEAPGRAARAAAEVARRHVQRTGARWRGLGSVREGCHCRTDPPNRAVYREARTSGNRRPENNRRSARVASS